MTVSDRQELFKKINTLLEQYKPFWEADGGDITLEDVTEDLVVKVKLHGACSSCSMSAMTLKSGVENAIKKVVPEIKHIEAINIPVTV